MDLLKIQALVKQTAHQNVLQNFNLTIPVGSQIGIQLSHVESRTLFDLLTGQTLPTSGTITGNTEEVKMLLADDGFYDQLTVNTYVQVFHSLAGCDQDRSHLLAQFSLSDVATRRIKQLSTDQRQRLALLRGSLLAPQLLLVESPLTKLTNTGIELYLNALKFVREEGLTILTTAYSLEELLLTSQHVYRYAPASGLVSTDLVNEVTSGNDEPLQPRSIFKVACKVDDKTVFFSPNEIDLVESINGVSQVSVNGEQFASAQTMSTLATKLTSFGFFRCHRSYLVNLQQIAELISYSRNSYTLILKNQARVPLSRSKLTELHQLIEF